MAVQEDIAALHEVGPNLDRGRRGRSDHGGATYPGVIALSHCENLDPAHVPLLKNPFGGTHVGQLAPGTGGHDHQLEVLGASPVDAVGESGGDLHLGVSRLDRPERLADGSVGDPGQAGQKRQFFRGLDLPLPPQPPVAGHPVHPGRYISEPGEIRRRQVSQFHPQPTPTEAQPLQQPGQAGHRIVTELVPHRHLGGSGPLPDHGLFHPHAHHRRITAGREARLPRGARA